MYQALTTCCSSPRNQPKVTHPAHPRSCDDGSCVSLLQGNTLAWAVACQEDQVGKPIAGLINFGPQHLSTADSKWAQQLSTAIHEIMVTSQSLAWPAHHCASSTRWASAATVSLSSETDAPDRSTHRRPSLPRNRLAATKSLSSCSLPCGTRRASTSTAPRSRCAAPLSFLCLW